MAGMLDGRVAIVTGGGRGIGRGHALELARQGAAVVVNDPGAGLRGEDTEERPADEVVAEITAAGGRATANYGSVSDYDGAGSMIQQAVAEFGRLDVVVNNAGILRDRMITSLSHEDFGAVIAVHLQGTFNVTKHACDHWREVGKGGGTNDARIINTTSGAGLRGNIGQSAYSAAKAGIVGLTLVTALEMRRYQVTANAISPMAFTRMVASTMERPEPEPEGGAFDGLDPANASGVVAYLASPASSWLTGQVLRIEGRTIQRMQGWSIDSEYSSRDGGRLQAGELVDALPRLYGTMPSGLDLGATAAANSGSK
ncbi:MAG TPA: SDR family NAD(P)-dependent oxidoreductase [Acidimicrobiia bacterium]|nr:SDR family NAD(P)-dependent oxidoreductase [Acidimicrobiia bacterium]